MIKNMRSLAALLFCLTASLASAQTGGTYWRLDRTGGPPYRLQFNVDGNWSEVGKVDGAGIFGLTGKINSSQTFSGSGTGQQALNSIHINDDSFSNPSGNSYGLRVTMFGRGPTANGFRFATGSLCQWDTPGDPASAPGFNGCVGVLGQGIANYDNTGGAVVKPGMWGGNSVVVAMPTAKNWGTINAHEMDTVAYAGSDYLQRVGSTYVLIGDGPQGSVRDAAIAFHATPNVLNPWKYLFSFDNLSGGKPIASDGTVLGSIGAIPIGNGIDLYTTTIANYFLRGPADNFHVTGAGAIAGLNATLKGPLSINTPGAPDGQKLVRLITNADGVLLIQAVTDDGITPSTYMSFTRSGATAAAVAFAKKVYFPAPADLAGINLAPGATPTTLQDGDLFPVSGSLFARLNATTKQFAFLGDAQTFSGLNTFTPGIVLPHGAAPGSPPDGQLWTTTSGLFGRINGATKQFATLSDAQTFTALQTFSGGLTVNGGIVSLNTPTTVTQTWDNPDGTFYGFSIDITDTNSLPASYPFRVRVNGADRFLVRKDGQTQIQTLSVVGSITGATHYGGAATNSALNLVSTTAAGLTDAINFKTGSGGLRWHINHADGDPFSPQTPNSYDVGDAVNTVRSIYLGTDVKIGGDKIIGARVTGWGAPSGALDRSAFATFAGVTVSPTFIQAEVQEIADACMKASQELGAVVTDLRTHGLIGN